MKENCSSFTFTPAISSSSLVFTSSFHLTLFFMFDYYWFLLLSYLIYLHSPCFHKSALSRHTLLSSLQLFLYTYIFCPFPQVDGVSLQGCSEQRAMEVLRRTGSLVRLRLLRKAVRLSHILPPVPPLQPLRHSHSFHEGNPYKVALNKIQETGAFCLFILLTQFYHDGTSFHLTRHMYNMLKANKLSGKYIEYNVQMKTKTYYCELFGSSRNSCMPAGKLYTL